MTTLCKDSLAVINVGIAHRRAGVGQIGAGVTHAPMACFTAAVKALASEVGAGRREITEFGGWRAYTASVK